ncbi:unnamed protein product [Phytophthora lilii]|uniref:Unnamed protein product n=1 Tax=Phytophthora lilii TaxID=2077276 RepID=A0A9W6XB50_9STRA|nr:unnamed protein product [Phytophthora lilii]
MQYLPEYHHDAPSEILDATFRNVKAEIKSAKAAYGNALARGERRGFLTLHVKRNMVDAGDPKNRFGPPQVNLRWIENDWWKVDV